LQSRVDTLHSQIESSTQQLASLHAQTDSARQQFAAIQQQQQSVAASVADESKNLASLRDQTRAAQQQLASLQMQQQSAAAAVKQSNDELAAIRTQADQARQDLARVQQQQTQQQQQANTAAAQELATLHSQLAQANREATALKRRRDAEALSMENVKSQRQAAASFPAAQPSSPPAATPVTAPPAPVASPSTAAPAQTQLTSAREQLAAGRPWEARHLLSMAQTQLAFQPVTPDQPIAQGGNVAATWVGQAIHWIDLGDTAQAYQAINHAIQLTSHGSNASYADTASDRSAYPPGYDQRYYQPH
jgi:predicted  nucleic acid-binding Zn-ribbon protein